MQFFSKNMNTQENTPELEGGVTRGLWLFSMILGAAGGARRGRGISFMVPLGGRVSSGQFCSLLNDPFDAYQKPMHCLHYLE